ncbi:Mobilization protein A [compost metagenome]
MSNFHKTVKTGKPGQAVEHSRYINREGKYKHRNDLVLKAHGNFPAWANNDPYTFWNTADNNERVNGAVYREFEVSLPSELTLKQQQELVNELIRTCINPKPYQYAIHAPQAALGKVLQPHAHIMFSDRLPDDIARSPELHFKRYNRNNPELGGCKKDSGGKDYLDLRNDLIAQREYWARIQNHALEKYGHPARVDHRSNIERGMRQPRKYISYATIREITEAEKKNNNK